MAAKAGKYNQNNSLPQFVVCDLDVETKEQMRAWVQDWDKVLDVVCKAVDSGIKISVNADAAHKCTQAFATGTSNVAGGSRLCLSARGPDFYGAVGALAFKFAVVLDGSLDNAMKQDDAFAIWG